MIEFSEPIEESKYSMNADGITFDLTHTGKRFVLEKTHVFRMYQTCKDWLDRYGAFDSYGRELKWPQ